MILFSNETHDSNQFTEPSPRENRPCERLLVENPERVRQVEWTKGGGEFELSLL